MTNETNGFSIAKAGGDTPAFRPLAVPPHPAPGQRADIAWPAPRAHQEALLGRRAPTSSDSSVGQEIRALRRSQGRTQKDLARAIGVTGAQLHRYETGTTRIATSRLIAIAGALGVGADTLIAAGYERPPATVAAPLAVLGGDDIVELIELFSTITDSRHRSALVAVARMMARPYQRDDSNGEG